VASTQDSLKTVHSEGKVRHTGLDFDYLTAPSTGGRMVRREVSSYRFLHELLDVKRYAIN